MLSICAKFQNIRIKYLFINVRAAAIFNLIRAVLYSEHIGEFSEQSNKNMWVNPAYKGTQTDR